MREPETPTDRLIDLHLGQLDPCDASELREAIAASEALRAKSDRCERILGALDAYAVAGAPGDLADRVLSRIAESEALIPFPSVDTPAALSDAREPAAAGPPTVALHELLAIAACIVLFFGIFIPGYYRAQRISERNLCRQNMHQVFAGLYTYEQANAEYLPYAGFIPNGSWLRPAKPGVVRASNTRHPYLLLKEGHVTNPRVFVCPADPRGLPMLMDNYRQARDFAEPGNCSYSVQNCNVERPLPMTQMSNRMAYLADKNPLFRSGVVHTVEAPMALNSMAHGSDGGQNVLFVDGHVRWEQKPTVGVAGDHIYLAGNRTEYAGTEPPTCATDTFLIP
jgi:prepilin-type processing-associated H-X9-DG protein